MRRHVSQTPLLFLHPRLSRRNSPALNTQFFLQTTSNHISIVSPPIKNHHFSHHFTSTSRTRRNIILPLTKLNSASYYPASLSNMFEHVRTISFKHHPKSAIMAATSPSALDSPLHLKPAVEYVEQAPAKTDMRLDETPAVQYGAKAQPNAPHERYLPQGLVETEEEQRKKWFIGSIDQGTTSSRFLIFDAEGTPIASHQIEFENLYPQSGWHEQDPQVLIDSVVTCVEEATKEFLKLGHKTSEIRTIGITNQRETMVCWDKDTGEPLYNAIAWPDTRTTGTVRELKNRPGADKLLQLTGLPLSTYPSSVKLIWLLKNNETVKKAYDEGRLAFGTVDTWLIYKLNGGKKANVHVTDGSNASRTMFMNIHTLQYDDTLLNFFKLNRKNITLPKIVPSSDPKAFGKVASGILAGTSITGCLGDQSSALVGQCGFSPGQAKNTYGTGCFLLYNVGEKPVISKHGLLTTIAFDFGGNRKPVYALEGSIAVAGAGVKFLMNNLGFIKHSSKITELAESVDDNGGVVFVTAFSGLFAPYWIDDAQGTLFGITQHTQKGHIARATLEATCYQTKAILNAMEKDSGHKLEDLAVDGGMCNSDLCMQTQADIIGIPVDRPHMRETTALGAAIAAGFAVDIWKEFHELKNINREDRTIFSPKIPEKQSRAMFDRWEHAVEMSKGWSSSKDGNADIFDG